MYLKSNKMGFYNKMTIAIVINKNNSMTQKHLCSEKLFDVLETFSMKTLNLI